MFCRSKFYVVTVIVYKILNLTMGLCHRFYCWFKLKRDSVNRTTKNCMRVVWFMCVPCLVFFFFFFYQIECYSTWALVRSNECSASVDMQGDKWLKWRLCWRKVFLWWLTWSSADRINFFPLTSNTISIICPKIIDNSMERSILLP